MHTGSNAAEPVDISAAAGHAASPGLEQQQSCDTLETTGSCSNSQRHSGSQRCMTVLMVYENFGPSLDWQEFSTPTHSSEQ